MPFVRNTAEDLSKHYEGLYLNSYLCPAGIPSIGYGHTENVQLGQRCTEAEADAWLAQDLAKAYAAVDELVKVEITTDQREALTDFVFNLGRGRLANSTLLKQLNAGNFFLAAEEFDKWVYGTDPKTKEKIKLEGLVKRRAEEKKLFTRGMDRIEPELPLGKPKTVKTPEKAVSTTEQKHTDTETQAFPNHNEGH